MAVLTVSCFNDFCMPIRKKKKKKKNIYVFLILFVMPVVLLFTLFTESRVGKSNSLEDVRSYRSFRQCYSLLADATAITANALYSLLSWLSHWMNLSYSLTQPRHFFRLNSYKHTTQSSLLPREYFVMSLCNAM